MEKGVRERLERKKKKMAKMNKRDALRSSKRVFEVIVGRHAPTKMPSLEGKGRNELMDMNGCGFGGGNAEGKRETDGKDEKAEKITHEMSHWQMKGWRDRGF